MDSRGQERPPAQQVTGDGDDGDDGCSGEHLHGECSESGMTLSKGLSRAGSCNPGRALSKERRKLGEDSEVFQAVFDGRDRKGGGFELGLPGWGGVTVGRRRQVKHPDGGTKEELSTLPDQNAQFIPESTRAFCVWCEAGRE